MRTPLLAAFCAAALVGASAQASPGQPSTAEQQLLDEINRARAGYGLSPLVADPRLGRAARAHSRAILRTGALEHGAIARRLQSYGVRSPTVGESLAWTVGARVPVRWIVSRWLRSAPHRAVLLSSRWRRLGVGDAAGPFQGFRSAHVLTADFAV